MKKGGTMDTRAAIAARRSIRRFQEKPIEEEKLQAILLAATQAPSGKNQQPWRFVVVAGAKRPEMVRVMKEGIAEAKARGEDAGSSEGSVWIMEQAPVTVFVFNPLGKPPWLNHSTGEMFDDVVNTQSCGAAIQNMLLAALDLGIGSLWICDIFYAYEKLQAWLGEPGEMIAAVALGYAGESPDARPRKGVAEVVRRL
jgi:nitroreductase